jgi:hypothetical protein
MRLLIIAAALASLAACGGDDSTSPGGANGTQGGQANLAGTWTGTIGGQGQSTPVTLSWVATSNTSTSSLTGPITATIVDNGSHTINGTFTATFTSTGMTFALAFPAGTFTSLGGPSSCSMTGSGTGIFGGNNTPPTISGSMTLTWAASCVGTVSDNATEVNQLSLKKS